MKKGWTRIGNFEQVSVMLGCLEQVTKGLETMEKRNEVLRGLGETVREYDLLERPVFVSSKMNRTAGFAHYTAGGVIALSTDLWEGLGINSEKCETLIHEGAHLIARYVFDYQGAHGEPWRHVMRCFGFENPERCYSHATGHAMREARATRFEKKVESLLGPLD